MYAYQYEGEHSISFINQNWATYSDFTHNFEKARTKQGLSKSEYLGHSRNADGRAHEDRNTWEDWGLIPTSRPLVAPPEQKRTKIEIPSTSGDLDLSYDLVPYPIFQNRTGSWEFKVASDKPWFVLQQEIGSYLHGRDVRVILKDDPAYYYTGVCYIESWDSANDGSGSTISIGYDLEPYKKYIYSSIDEWEWNPFNFYTDVVPTKVFKNYTVDCNTTGYGWLWTKRKINKLKGKENDKYWEPWLIDLTGKIGSMPVVPTIKISKKLPNTVLNPSSINYTGCVLYIRYRNPSIRTSYFKAINITSDIEKKLNSADNNYEYEFEDPEIIFYDSFKHQNNDISFYIGQKGNGMGVLSNFNINIDFTRGEIL